MQRKAKEGAERGLRVLYACSWTSGPDATADSLVQLVAQAFAGDEPASERFERACAGPGAIEPKQAWSELEFLAANALVIVPVADEFESWRTHALGAEGRVLRVLGLN